MIETAGQIVVGVRRLLRTPSDLKLPSAHIRAELTDLCRGYIEEESLSPRDRTSQVADIRITEAPIDYYVNMGDVADYEEQMLEYTLASNSSTDHWYKANIVPLSTWSVHFNRDYVAAAFYGSEDETAPARVKINLTPDEVAWRLWRLTYRMSFVTALQTGENPPLPAAHIPMLKREAAILLMPQVQDNSPEWIEWMQRTLPIYEAKLMEQKAAWREYLVSSVEQQEQPIARNDRYGQRRSGVRPYVPAQP